jgi:ABC-type Fe3+/spermidine/putrescine transport system ATPase subunit
VRLELKAIQRSLGITTVMVTHDQDEAMSLSDQVVLMSGGRVEQVDTPDALYHRPATRFAAGFLGSAAFLDGTWDGAAIVTPAGERFPARADAAKGTALTGVLRPEEVRPAPEGTGVPATVTDVDFLGEVVRYALRTRGGQELRLHLSGQHGRLKEGESLCVTWPESAVWILPGHTGSATKPGRDRATTPEPTTERTIS